MYQAAEMLIFQHRCHAMLNYNADSIKPEIKMLRAEFYTESD